MIWPARPVHEIAVSLPWVGVGFNGLRAGPNAALSHFTRAGTRAGDNKPERSPTQNQSGTPKLCPVRLKKLVTI